MDQEYTIDVFMLCFHCCSALGLLSIPEFFFFRSDFVLPQGVKFGPQTFKLQSITVVLSLF